MILSINHIQLVAEKDLVIQLRDFYCDVVGLTEGFRPAFERFGFWLYIGDKDVLHLITPKEGDGRSLQKSSFDHVAFKTYHYEDVLKKLKIINNEIVVKWQRLFPLLYSSNVGSKICLFSHGGLFSNKRPVDKDLRNGF